MARDPRIKITAEDKTKAAFTSARRNVEGLGSSLLGMRGQIAGLIGAAGLGALVKQVADTGDKLQKLSISLGVTTEALSQYDLVAARAGTDLDKLSLIWQRQTRRVAEAAVGTGEARDALRELGLEADQLNKLAPDEQFEVIARAMDNVENSADRLRLAFKLFDSEGARPALQIMEGGVETMRAIRAEADAMGLTMTRVQADQMAQFNDQLTNVTKAAQGAIQTLVVSMGPSIIEIARAFATATTEVAQFIDRLKGLDGRTNLEGLREDLQETTIKAAELGTWIESLEQRNKNVPESLRAQYQAAREEMTATIARIGELTDEAEANSQRINDFQVTPGQLPSLGDEADNERAEKEAVKLRERLEARIETIREFSLTELELLQEQHSERIAIINQAEEDRMINEAEAHNIRLGLEEKYQRQKNAIIKKGETDREKFEKKSRLHQAKDVSEHLVGLLDVAAQHNRAMFNLQKAAAITLAIINAHEGASKTLATYPWPLGGILAAVHYAAGVARVAAIAGTQFGSSSSSGAGGVSGGSVSPTPVYQADPVFGLPESTRDAPQTVQSVTINLGDDDQLITTSAVRRFIEQINEQAADGVLIGSIKVA